MSADDIRQFFEHDLARMLGGEETMAKGLQRMIEEVENEGLQTALREHVLETQQQIANLIQAFRHLNLEPRRSTCESAEGLAREFAETIEGTSSQEVVDLAAALAVEKAEQLEIVSYRGLLSAAGELGNPDVVQLLRENLRQEENMALRAEQFSHELMLVHL